VNFKFNLLLILFITLNTIACSSIKKYRPAKHVKNKPKAYLKIDGTKTDSSFQLLGFGSERLSSVHIKTKNTEEDCYHYLGTITVKRNRSSDSLEIPADKDMFLKFQRIVQKTGGNVIRTNIKDSFFEFSPEAGKHYALQFDDATKGMEAIRFIQTQSAEASDANPVESFYDEPGNSKYDNECKG